MGSKKDEMGVELSGSVQIGLVYTVLGVSLLSQYHYKTSQKEPPHNVA